MKRLCEHRFHTTLLAPEVTPDRARREACCCGDVIPARRGDTLLPEQVRGEPGNSKPRFIPRVDGAASRMRCHLVTTPTLSLSDKIRQAAPTVRSCGDDARDSPKHSAGRGDPRVSSPPCPRRRRRLRRLQGPRVSRGELRPRADPRRTRPRRQARDRRGVSRHRRVRHARLPRAVDRGAGRVAAADRPRIVVRRAGAHRRRASSAVRIRSDPSLRTAGGGSPHEPISSTSARA